MVAPRLRSNSVKKRSVKTPGGRVVNIYKPKKVGKAICGLCGNKLNAVPNRSSSGMRKLAKTQKRPERMFGGVLCGNDLRMLIKEKIRMESGIILREEVDLTHLKYIDMMKR
ncbi:50S ribosomal protein L34e [Candidatus Micrarchaeota archaeon]|nr:50S ribosomal protein L34e [Candidatus Micrarchaeota archaeon]